MRIRSLLIGLLKKYIEKLLPVKYQLPLRYFYSQKANKLDAEMAYVSNLLKEKRRFLDIGANIGIYSFHFKKSFKSIDAFEPLKEISYRLEYFQNPYLKVHNCALSNKKGECKIYIPYFSGKAIASLASLEKRDGDCEVRTVKVDKIDNYDLHQKLHLNNVTSKQYINNFIFLPIINS